MTSSGDSYSDMPNVEPVIAYLDERFGLDTLWLYGSQAAGTATRESDIDLAGLFRRRPGVAELFEARGELGARLGHDVDLVDLDRVSPILAMQVLRKGRLVLDRNPGRRARFVAAAPSRYEDVRIMRREVERALVARVKRGRA